MRSWLVSRLISGPRFKGRERLIRYLIRDGGVVRSAYGPLMVVHPRDWTNMASALGVYGYDLVNQIHALPNDGIFIDIGANTGIYSLVAADHLTSGIAISFEPNRHIFSDFLNNIKINSLENVVPIMAAVGRKSMMSSIVFSETHSGGGSLRPDASGDAMHSMCLVMDGAGLSFLRDLSESRQVLCKVDTEGHELEVVAALQSAHVLENIDALFIEIDEENLLFNKTSSAELYEFLAKAGFGYRCQPGSLPHYDELFVRDTCFAREAGGETKQLAMAR